MDRTVWSIREGGFGEFDAPEVMNGYRSARAPRPGDILSLPDGSGPWRVVDRAFGNRADASENVVVVELFGD